MEQGGDLARRLERALEELDEVRLAYLFGSHARDRARSESDVDVAVLVDEPAAADAEARLGTVRRLAGRLGREVASTRLDIVLLNHAPVLLRHRVLRDGVLLHERSPEERVRFTVRTLREYQDGAVRRDWFLRRRIRALAEEDPHGGPGDLLEKARGAARLLAKAERVPGG
jgi:predicted nucleotidyltransferase